MEFTTIKISTLTVDVLTARKLLENLNDFFGLFDKSSAGFEEVEFVEGDLYLLAVGEIDGKQPVALEIYVDPLNTGEVELKAEITD